MLYCLWPGQANTTFGHNYLPRADGPARRHSRDWPSPARPPHALDTARPPSCRTLLVCRLRNTIGVILVLRTTRRTVRSHVACTCNGHAYTHTCTGWDGGLFFRASPRGTKQTDCPCYSSKIDSYTGADTGPYHTRPRTTCTWAHTGPGCGTHMWDAVFLNVF